MDDIRKLFHVINNGLNTIAVETGAALEGRTPENAEAISHEELKSEYAKILQALARAEEAALKTGEWVRKAREVVYQRLGVSTEGPGQSKGD